MVWASIILSLVFILSAGFLLNRASWPTGLNIQRSGLSAVSLPPRPSFRRRKNTPSSRVSYAATAFTRERALRSFSRYLSIARGELSSKRKGVNSLRGRHARIADEIGYGDKLGCFGAAIDTNCKVTDAIARFGSLENEKRGSDLSRISTYGANSWSDDGPTDLARVVEALKHCVRDWSADGADERNRVFAPILEVLRQVPVSERMNTKVLVPGAGLGRLAWEIARMGFDVTANEVSSYMTLPLKMLLADATTPTQNFHTVCPHYGWFSHTRSNSALFRSTSFPDVLPRVGTDRSVVDFQDANTTPNQESESFYSPGGKFDLVESDFLSLSPPNRDHQPDIPTSYDAFLANTLPVVPSQPRDRGYDFIVTLFFIDTATNILAYLDQIYALLRFPIPSTPNQSPTVSQPRAGTWINLGPLLWPSGAALEPSLEEVLAMSKRVGLDVVGEPGPINLLEDGGSLQERVNPLEARRTLECQYTANRAGMMKWMYQAEFWVARRRGD
ncbi:N2227-domain-containing protein [Ceratobasidium sp. AG-I]|nr:N2227-domain-containing protein [Ceratobasidium sp. AG-I]